MNKLVNAVKTGVQAVTNFVKRNAKPIACVAGTALGLGVCSAADVTIPDPSTAVSTIETVIGGIMVFSVGAWGLARALKLGSAWLNKGK